MSNRSTENKSGRAPAVKGCLDVRCDRVVDFVNIAGELEIIGCKFSHASADALEVD